MVINYLASACIAVVIAFIYYSFVYQPSQDPFGKTDESAPTFVSNPVDELYLGWLRRWTEPFIRCVKPDWVKPHISKRLERIFIKV